MRRLLVAAAVLAALCGTANAGSGAVAVPLDEVRIMTFAKPVATLYVGNPVIADITVIDSRHAFVQGKAYGATNVVALDAGGRQVANRQIVVAGNGTAVVTLQRGNAQTTYACAASRCQIAPQPGDGKEVFEAAAEQVSKHQSMLTNAAEGGGQ
jgi:Flp pilus assembly secretin CpaC